MIESLKKWLIAHDFIAPGQVCKLCFRLCGNWSALCYVDKQLTYFIKIEHYGSIQEEFQTLQFMHTVMPQFVLKPIAIKKWDDKVIYIQKAHHHHVLSRDVWLNSQSAHEYVMDFLLGISDLQLKNQYLVDERLIVPYKRYCPKGYAKRLASLSLPQVMQHGDFSLNNIGYSQDQLIVFDWEDYGLSAFPLLDSVVFLSSLCDYHDVKWLKLSSQEALQNWLEPLLETFGLSYDEYLFCMPYALMVFISMKQQMGYPHTLIQKIDIFLKSLIKAQEGVVCA